jgi:hypothetical protein
VLTAATYYGSCPATLSSEQITWYACDQWIYVDNGVGVPATVRVTPNGATLATETICPSALGFPAFTYTADNGTLTLAFAPGTGGVRVDHFVLQP